MKILISLAAVLILAVNPALGDSGEELNFPELPYDYDALEPHIDARTMEIHYSRHHRGYFDKLLDAVEGTDLEGQSIEQILSEADRFPDAVRNNAGGHYNHSLFWTVISPDGGGRPDGPLAEAIKEEFGSVAEFRDEFENAALSRFGSGWAWLCVDQNGDLFVTSTPNQDNPIMDVAENQGTPILGIDLWEHAYYLNYQNERGQYVDAFWEIVDWDEVAERYKNAR